MRTLLQQAIAPIELQREPSRDLWPAVVQKLDARQPAPWLDLALLSGLVAMAALFPAAIPVLLFYL